MGERNTKPGGRSEDIISLPVKINPLSPFKGREEEEKRENPKPLPYHEAQKETLQCIIGEKVFRNATKEEKCTFLSPKLLFLPRKKAEVFGFSSFFHFREATVSCDLFLLHSPDTPEKSFLAPIPS